MPKKKTNVHYSFRVKGEFPPVILEEVPELHRARADEKDCIAFGWSGKKSQDLLLGCRRCGEPLLRRSRVVELNNIHCRSCIRKPYEKAAAKFGATIIGKDPEGDRHDRILKLRCGHLKKLQRGQILRVADGSVDVDCISCRLERYNIEARAFDWTFLSMSTDRSGYGLYRHECGVVQEISIGNMRSGQCSCRVCGDQVKPGRPGIYIFKIELPDLPVIKLGYSKRHIHRLRRDLRIAKSVPTRILRFLPLADRPLAISEERRAHRYLCEHYPDWVVPKQIFGDAIFVKSEIYRPEALPTMNRLLDEIARKHPAPLS